MRRARVPALVAVVCTALGALAAPAAAESADVIQWVAMGDSYAAGVIPAAGVEVTGGGQRDGCARTAGSYPEVLRTRLGDAIDLTNVSCGGATIAEVVSDPQSPNGYNLPFFEVYDPGYPFSPVDPQVSAIPESANVVSVQVGGNTLGFAELIYVCLQLGSSADKDTDHPCADYFTSGGDGVPTITERLTEVSRQYGEMLGTIQAVAPNAKVLALGYPAIIPEDPSTCAYGFDAAGLRNFATATYPDLDFLRTEVLERFNATIAQQAATHNVTYVDVYTPTVGHDVCSSDKWIEGLADRSGGWALVHPNAAGHARIADLLEAAVGLG
ncbi:SGNH/GDSL hydrolase family protein [Actinokineospora auranticolor]|uniref:Lysophospholipase L1-like esterase n=1 Tax=Actinokineospora auranticolor TaxID=155976 RepID=A0A2S6GEG8_9PSEU|nr:SGNH/GDSL hydrolase family protein [Actinokineospora auranticolor]PPK63625.1 lysophospholipase L1-like esterase [Actinokineospora auranticolor]